MCRSADQLCSQFDETANTCTSIQEIPIVHPWQRSAEIDTYPYLHVVEHRTPGRLVVFDFKRRTPGHFAGHLLILSSARKLIRELIVLFQNAVVVLALVCLKRQLVRFVLQCVELKRSKAECEKKGIKSVRGASV